MSALFTVPTAVPAASISFPAPPFPLSAAAAGGGPTVVAVLFVPFSLFVFRQLSFEFVKVRHLWELKTTTLSETALFSWRWLAKASNKVNT